jgi:hypothetical protein
MVTKELLGAAAVLLPIAGYGRYMWDVFLGRTKPHVFSWLVWGIVTSIVFFAQLSDKAGPGSWTMGLGALIYFSIAVTALFRGEKDIRRSDWVAFLGALAAIPVWRATGEPLAAVILVTVIDALAFYPTFRKSYAKPHEETLFMYTIDVLRFGLSLMALETYSAVTALYPLFIIAADLSFIGMALWRRNCLGNRGAVATCGSGQDAGH